MNVMSYYETPVMPQILDMRYDPQEFDRLSKDVPRELAAHEQKGGTLEVAGATSHRVAPVRESVSGSAFNRIFDVAPKGVVSR